MIALLKQYFMVRMLCVLAASAALLMPASFALAQAAEKAAAATLASKPLWSELSAQEKAALAPLAARWDSLSQGHKRKWISASKDYSKLAPTEQAKVHARMNEWASLTPIERANARQNFAEHKALTDGLTPEQRKVQWDAYQQLSPEQKRKLAENAGKPDINGAALASKPQPVLKKEPAPEFGTAKVLAKAKAASAPATGKIAVAPHMVQQGAILPGSVVNADSGVAK